MLFLNFGLFLIQARGEKLPLLKILDNQRINKVLGLSYFLNLTLVNER